VARHRGTKGVEEVAFSERYGRLDIPSVGEREPVFILRAKDRLAADAIKMYKLLAEAYGCDLGDLIERQIRIFNEWAGERALPCNQSAFVYQVK
jgi:hypothetical protein